MIPTRRNSTSRSSKGSRRSIKGSNAKKAAIPMAKANKVPPGAYRSKVLAVEDSVTQAGDPAVTIVYELTSPDGSQFKIREVIPVDSFFFEKFGDAMIAAGLEEGEDLLDAVGIEEEVFLDYPTPGSIGHFKSRRPVTVGVTPATSDGADTSRPFEGVNESEDFDDDFLSDDD